MNVKPTRTLFWGAKVMKYVIPYEASERETAANPMHQYHRYVTLNFLSTKYPFSTPCPMELPYTFKLVM